MSNNLLVALLMIASLAALLVGWMLRPLAGVWQRIARRKGWISDERTLGVDGEGYLNLHWSGDETAAREGIAGAFDLIAALLPKLGLVSSTESLEIRNPETSFCVTPERLQRLTRNFGAGQAILLLGEHVECGTLLVNNDLALDLEFDFRSPVACHVSLLLPGEGCAGEAERLLPGMATQFGFTRPSSADEN